MNAKVLPLGLVLLFTLLTACQKEKKEDSVPTDAVVVDIEPPIVDYSLHCAERFSKIWCSGNLLVSDILEVCVGEIVLDDRTHNAISLTTAEEDNCFIESRVETPVTLPGCINANSHEFVGDLRGSNPFEAIICKSSLGRPAYIEGESFLNQSFRAMNIE